MSSNKETKLNQTLGIINFIEWPKYIEWVYNVISILQRTECVK